jgi:hypothetical protein
MAKKAIKKTHKPKTMAEASAGFEEFMKKHKKKAVSKAKFEKLLGKTKRPSSAK